MLDGKTNKTQICYQNVNTPNAQNNENNDPK